MIFVASDLDPSRENQHVPGPSLWPVGLAVGVVVLLVGFVVSATVVVIGGLITLVFAFLPAGEISRRHDAAWSYQQPNRAYQDLAGHLGVPPGWPMEGDRSDR